MAGQGHRALECGDIQFLLFKKYLDDLPLAVVEFFPVGLYAYFVLQPPSGSAATVLEEVIGESFGLIKRQLK